VDGVQQFIADARAKGMDDAHIRELLLGNGWVAGQIDAALGGLNVPPPPAAVAPAPAPSLGVAPASPTPATPAGRPSISALEAALQHVLLWLFTATSSVMIGIVSATLFGSGDGSSESLLTYVVMETVTFLPFLGLFYYYLRQQKKQPDLTTGRVWSIITIVLHSIGALGAIIALILILVLVRDGDTAAGLAASTAIAVMNILVVAAYVLANFTKTHNTRFHRRALVAFPIALAVLVASFGVLALVRVGPLRADDQTRQNLVSSAESVRSYTKSNDRLPATAAQVPKLAEGVSYKKLTSSTYELCATFNNDRKGYGDKTISDDSYISKYEFENNEAGENCWTFKSYSVQNSSVDYCDLYGRSSSLCRNTVVD
jgi:hypothetical protein